MKHLKLMMSVLIVAGMLTTILVSCNDDEAPAELTLKTLTADGVDLNGVTGATGVPVDATIVATFSTNVDPATTDAITLTRDYDDTEFPATISVSGNEVTITPDEDFTRPNARRIGVARIPSGTMGCVTAGARAKTSIAPS